MTTTADHQDDNSGAGQARSGACGPPEALERWSQLLGDGRREREKLWSHAAAVATALVLVSGAIVYGLLATAYDTFYGELGLTPADLGLQQGRPLAGGAAWTVALFLSTGVATAGLGALYHVPNYEKSVKTHLAAVLAIGSLVLALIGLGYLALEANYELDTLANATYVGIALTLLGGVLHQYLRHSWDAALVYAAAVSVTSAWLALSLYAVDKANELADDVKDGRYVKPPESDGLVFFSVHAMPVVGLEATTDVQANLDFAQERDENRLMYLGSANSMLVLYDHDEQETLILHATQFRAPVLNCETTRLDDRIYEDECSAPD